MPRNVGNQPRVKFHVRRVVTLLDPETQKKHMSVVPNALKRVATSSIWIRKSMNTLCVFYHRAFSLWSSQWFTKRRGISMWRHKVRQNDLCTHFRSASIYAPPPETEGLKKKHLQPTTAYAKLVGDWWVARILEAQIFKRINKTQEYTVCQNLVPHERTNEMQGCQENSLL